MMVFMLTLLEIVYHFNFKYLCVWECVNQTADNTRYCAYAHMYVCTHTCVLTFINISKNSTRNNLSFSFRFFSCF